MANIMAGVFYILGAAGYMTYPVKYMETQFQKSPAQANIIAGTVLHYFHTIVD
jgi:predicted membrane channel-forming protein YqfA (hemolysin III family)